MSGRHGRRWLDPTSRRSDRRPRLVRPRGSPLPVPGHDRPVPRPRLRDDPPADPGRPRRTGLGGVHRAVPDGRGARRGLAGRRPAGLARARLQPPGAQPPAGGHGSSSTSSAAGFPRDVAGLERLPGVGPYTARAVAAIAFGLPVGAVDTNVRRVLGRAVAGDADGAPAGRAPGARRRASCRGRPTGATGPHALMDLGSTVCRPRGPRCDDVPDSRWPAACRGRGPRRRAPGRPRSRRADPDAPTERPSASARAVRARRPLAARPDPRPAAGGRRPGLGRRSTAPIGDHDGPGGRGGRSRALAARGAHRDRTGRPIRHARLPTA